MKRLKRPADARRRAGPGARRMAARLLMIGALLVVVAGGLLIWLAFFTDVCAVRNVLVTGNKNLTPEYVHQLSGVDSYENLITLPVRKLSRNLERNPWIKEARIGRHLLHTVTIRVMEREPMAMLDTGGAGFLLDDSGFVITGITIDQFPQLPRIYGGEVAPPRISEQVRDPRVAGCVKVIRSMPRSLRSILQLGNPFDGRGQVFVSRIGFNIVYGAATDLALKNEILEAIVTDIRNNNRSIAYIDVRVANAPVIMPR